MVLVVQHTDFEHEAGLCRWCSHVMGHPFRYLEVRRLTVKEGSLSSVGARIIVIGNLGADETGVKGRR